MNIDINDPRITQYALGEMTEDEQQAFENEINGNPEILREIKEIKQFSTELDTGFNNEPELSLSDTRKKNIKESLGNVKRKNTNNTLLIKVILTTAAMVVFTAIVFHEKIISFIEGPTNSFRSKGKDIIVEMKVIDKPNIPPMPYIPEPPLSEEEYKLEIERPTANVNNVKVRVEDVNITVPNLLEVKKTESSLKMHVSGISKRASYKDSGLIVSMPDLSNPKFNTENYNRIVENQFMEALNNPLSTFSIDVDTASYSNMRRFLNQGELPPSDAVRIEEMVNYFDYEYSQPETGKPFSVNFEMASCPWQPKHRLVRVGLKGKEIAEDKRPSSNLVFLLDVSGSMSDRNKLPLLKQSMKLLVEKLGENDRVAIVVYAGSSGLVLPSTTADKKDVILSSLERLSSGGSTNGGAGIELAYKIAATNFIEGGTNRVILATDGDFNVGTTDEGSLERLIETKAKSGVFLSILGFGMGNYKDNNLEKLSGKGNGNYAYIDTLNEAQKVLVNEMGSTLITIAKDVKIQVEFNPELVEAYRLIGYENRMLKKEDFNNDKKDAGEIGAGHTVTAFYEIVPKGVKMPTPKVDPLKYQKPKKAVDTGTEFSDEVMTVKLRYKEPDGNESKLIAFPLKNEFKEYASASDDFKFASSVAAFGMLLRNSEHKRNATYGTVLELAEEGLRNDKHGYKKEFLNLIKKAQKLNSIKREETIIYAK